MWALLMLCSLAAASGFWLMNDEISPASASPPAPRFLALNMSTYRAAVVGYVQAHPGEVVDASVSDASLTFPAWYAGLAPWRNYVSGASTVVIYAQAADSESLSEELAELSHHSILAGLALPAEGGIGTEKLTVHAPGHGDSGIVLPPIVPSGSVVWLASLK